MKRKYALTLYVSDPELARKLMILGLTGKRSDYLERALLESPYFEDKYFQENVVSKLESVVQDKIQEIERRRSLIASITGHKNSTTTSTSTVPEHQPRQPHQQEEEDNKPKVINIDSIRDML